MVPDLCFAMPVETYDSEELEVHKLLDLDDIDGDMDLDEGDMDGLMTCVSIQSRISYTLTNVNV